MLKAVALFVVSVAATALTASVQAPNAAAKPGFDCAKGQSDAEKLVCKDPQLSALARELLRVYRNASQPPSRPSQRAELQATQRGLDQGSR